MESEPATNRTWLQNAGLGHINQNASWKSLEETPAILCPAARAPEGQQLREDKTAPGRFFSASPARRRKPPSVLAPQREHLQAHIRSCCHTPPSIHTPSPSPAVHRALWGCLCLPGGQGGWDPSPMRRLGWRPSGAAAGTALTAALRAAGAGEGAAQVCGGQGRAVEEGVSRRAVGLANGHFARSALDSSPIRPPRFPRMSVGGGGG